MFRIVHFLIRSAVLQDLLSSQLSQQLTQKTLSFLSSLVDGFNTTVRARFTSSFHEPVGQDTGGHTHVVLMLASTTMTITAATTTTTVRLGFVEKSGGEIEEKFLTALTSYRALIDPFISASNHPICLM